jgi:hypothetical protein
VHLATAYCQKTNGDEVPDGPEYLRIKIEDNRVEFGDEGTEELTEVYAISYVVEAILEDYPATRLHISCGAESCGALIQYFATNMIEDQDEEPSFEPFNALNKNLVFLQY